MRAGSGVATLGIPGSAGVPEEFTQFTLALPYNDHRMAMCFAILGLNVPGIKIKNPACVKKTFPNFFQKLATPPPKGLGATIRDAKTGRKLAVEELFAE